MDGTGNTLDQLELARRLSPAYAAVEVVGSTGSTNADLLAEAQRGAADRTALIAEEQTAGRGRRSREWVSPRGSGLYLSVLLRPVDVPPSQLGTLSLVAGLALARTVTGLGVDAVLKWPNDLLAGPARAKCAGVLSEVDPASTTVVVGIGLNVTPLSTEVPAGAGGLPATSLAAEGARDTDRTEVAVALLSAFAELELAWRHGGGDLERAGLLDEYRERCVTLGSEVRVELPDAAAITGVAADVDGSGQLILDAGDTRKTVSAGDVVHLRANSG
ncbi:BirA family biotin operon repressor/biotin-[acetyl-CoA-carboxylase] ligase [Herbihabitans rhizosphaerae]|uniref:biotin--[biotin carboxyl-carrier protein] ligase n=1 Tax=Herbihabitans rhizosphaerae TaxID=1872711 RepID=A0A4Q7KG91_9PSEU|nr:biotin--[acetyl-CoA-carboxylase] ligase [Herbihabitans rhizosphaerae]RZS33861.1 BirA family biotin operon repressor/biotin-[acetyl-CoA-carboxylase] ligase [Herbihabitans rhizosphaerae]